MRKMLILTVTCLAMLLFGSSSTATAEYDPKPENFWDVKDKTDTVMHTGAIRALVWDLHEYQGKMYVGGTFQTVVSPQGEEFDHSFLAAFDIDTGEWDRNFKPNLDNAIYSIEHTADGRLIVGGEITGGMAALDPETGATLNSFTPDISNSWGFPAVFDIEVVGNQLYVGGTFSAAQGTPLTSIGRFSAANGDLDESWIPSLQKYTGPNYKGNSVHGIAVDTERERVYIAGKFGSVDNVGSFETALESPRSDFFATLDPDTAKLKRGLTHGFPVGVASYDNSSNRLWDVQTDGNRVYIGGKPHQTAVLNADDLSPITSYYSLGITGVDANGGGDNQAIDIGEKYVWASCHCWGSVTHYPLGVYSPIDERMSIAQYRIMAAEFKLGNVGIPQRARGVYGFNKLTGEILTVEFDMRGQGGGWALKEDSNGRLWVGGQFTQGAGKSLNGLARFSLEEPAVEISVEICEASYRDSTVHLSWESSDTPAKFVVRRSVNGSGPYWRGSVDGDESSFVDTNRDAELNYFVEARVGQNSSAPVKCVVNETPPDVEVAAVSSCETLFSGDQIEISWPAAVGAERYIVYRSVNGSRAYWRGSVEVTSFTDTNRNATIEYSVVSVATDESRSSATNCVVAGAPVEDTPPAVTRCDVRITGNGADIDWPSAGDGVEYIVSRSVDGGTVWWRGKTTETGFGDSTRSGLIEYSVVTLANNQKSQSTTCSPTING